MQNKPKQIKLRHQEHNMAELKHVGRMKGTNKKCIVAFRTLPGDAYSCLVIPTESLDDSYHNSIINLVESPAGQASYEFAEAMDRTSFSDGSRMLPSLHAKGKLVKIGTDSIEMLPRPGVSILLSELNQIIAEQRGLAVDGLSIQPELSDQRNAEKAVQAEKTEVAKQTATVTETAVEEVAMPTTFDSAEDQAKFYRSQADKLAKEAAAMRRKAEELVPTKKVK